jgi:hypothetical protein
VVLQSGVEFARGEGRVFLFLYVYCGKFLLTFEDTSSRLRLMLC